MKYPEEYFINKVICGNVLDELRKFPSDCVDTIITSPPYWGLRDYGEDTKTKWQDGWFGQLGLEPTLDLYIEHLLQITAELKRVLKKTGVMFWNMGDCYHSHSAISKNVGGFQGKQMKKNKEYFDSINMSRGDFKQIPDKCLALQNWRLILRMIDEQGWILRNTIIWNKPNAMPSSVKDRFANKYEPVFFLTKSQKYFFDLDAVRIPAKTNENRPLRKESFNYRVRDSQKKSEQCPQFKTTKEEIERYKKETGKIKGGGANLNLPWNPLTGGKIYKTSIPEDQAESFGSPRARYWRDVKNRGNAQQILKERGCRPTGIVPNGFDHNLLNNPLGKNPGDVWKIATQPCPKEYRGKHFAMFPEKLVEPMILAGCPAQICKKCGKARERITNKKYTTSPGQPPPFTKQQGKQFQGKIKGEMKYPVRYETEYQTIGWTKCNCENPEYEAGIVLDPFCGLGTTCVVAKRLNRNYIGIEISKEYAKLAEKRINNTPTSLF